MDRNRLKRGEEERREVGKRGKEEGKRGEGESWSRGEGLGEKEKRENSER